MQTALEQSSQAQVVVAREPRKGMTLSFPTVLAWLFLAAVSVLFLLLAVVVMPAAASLLGWAMWRSARDARPAVARMRARWGRSARVLEGGTVR